MADRTADVAVQVRQLFDAKAATWPSKYRQDGRLAGRLTRLVDAVTYHVPAGGSVLDLGCGTGELANAIADAGLQATGCDISPEMLHRAAAADPAGTVNWVQLDLGWRVLPFGLQEFDAVVASSVLEYVGDPAMVLRECARVIRPGGMMLCTVPNPRHPVRWLESLIRPAATWPLSSGTGGRWPQLDRYLVYLRISRQRHSAAEWCAIATQTGLLAVPQLSDLAERSPLRLLTFHRPER
jgi:2-polyprenyl-3-methyl-5-hydroxy-6-metoxy-1,4-benzoquinol methylase